MIYYFYQKNLLMKYTFSSRSDIFSVTLFYQWIYGCNKLKSKPRRFAKSKGTSFDKYLDFSGMRLSTLDRVLLIPYYNLNS